MPRLTFPMGSLLADMLGEGTPMDVRRAVRRLRSETAPALAIHDDVEALARGLSLSEVSSSPAVLDTLPPLFWMEARRDDGAGARRLGGWVVEKKGGGLVVRGFSLPSGAGAAPEPEGSMTLSFGLGVREEDEEARTVRGLVAAVALPGMLSQMGETSPVVVMPADASEADAAVLRGFRLAVAVPPDAVSG